MCPPADYASSPTAKLHRALKCMPGSCSRTTHIWMFTLLLSDGVSRDRLVSKLLRWHERTRWAYSNCCPAWADQLSPIPGNAIRDLSSLAREKNLAATWLRPCKKVRSFTP